MHLTRLEVDRLLAEGKINEAESYMESRRIFFWENGYLIRRLNQAILLFMVPMPPNPEEQQEKKVLIWEKNSDS